MQESGVMTHPAPSSFDQSMARAAQHHHVEMWRAAQTVRSHVQHPTERADLLDCLGLTDVTRPTGC
jgi:hypothetical protein